MQEVEPREDSVFPETPPAALPFWQHDMETVDFTAIAQWVKELEEKWGRKLVRLEIKKYRTSPHFAVFLVIAPEAPNAQS